MQFEKIQSCNEFSEWHLAEACLTPHHIAKFCLHLEEICRPNNGEILALAFLGRLALSDISKLCPDQRMTLIIQKESPPDVVLCQGAFLILKNKTEEILCLHLYLDWETLEKAIQQGAAKPFRFVGIGPATQAIILEATPEERQQGRAPFAFEQAHTELWRTLKSIEHEIKDLPVKTDDASGIRKKTRKNQISCGPQIELTC